jgi:hypothetical protein
LFYRSDCFGYVSEVSVSGHCKQKKKANRSIRRAELIFKKIAFNKFCFTATEISFIRKKSSKGKETNAYHSCAADFSLLNLPKGKSLGRSKPATNS